MEEKKERLGTVLYNLAESLRFASVLLSAFLPSTSEKINAQLNITTITWDSLSGFDGTTPGTEVKKGEALLSDTTKTKAGKRILTMTEDVKNLLIECIGDKTEGLIFTHNGKMITTNQVNAQFSRILKKYDIF